MQKIHYDIERWCVTHFSPKLFKYSKQKHLGEFEQCHFLQRWMIEVIDSENMGGKIIGIVECWRVEQDERDAQRFIGLALFGYSDWQSILWRTQLKCIVTRAVWSLTDKWSSFVTLDGKGYGNLWFGYKVILLVRVMTKGIITYSKKVRVLFKCIYFQTLVDNVTFFT